MLPPSSEPTVQLPGVRSELWVKTAGQWRKKYSWRSIKSSKCMLLQVVKPSDLVFT